MKKIMILSLLLLACTAGRGALAQGEEWRILSNEAKALYKQGFHERAIEVQNKALRVAENGLGPNHLDVSSILSYLAGLHAVRGQFVEAEPLFERALSERTIQQ